jgi:hypothetical protein
MEQADGAELNITAKGGLNTGTILFKSLYTVDDISTGLLSIQEVRNNNKWFIVPPRSLSKKYGAIVADTDGTILCLGDSKFRSNVDYVYRHDEKIKLPDVSALEGAKKTKSIYKTSSIPDYEHQSDVSVINLFSNVPSAIDYVSSEWPCILDNGCYLCSNGYDSTDRVVKTTLAVSRVYGIEHMTVEEQFLLFQKSLMVPKESLIWMSEMGVSGRILNFPFTPDQVRRYYQQDPCYIKGNMQKRKVS